MLKALAFLFCIQSQACLGESEQNKKNMPAPRAGFSYFTTFGRDSRSSGGTSNSRPEYRGLAEIYVSAFSFWVQHRYNILKFWSGQKDLVQIGTNRSISKYFDSSGLSA